MSGQSSLYRLHTASGCKFSGNRMAIRQSVAIQSLTHVRLFVTLWTTAHQAPLSMGFPRQEYWSGLPVPSPGDILDKGIKPTSLASPALAGIFFNISATWEAQEAQTRSIPVTPTQEGNLSQVLKRNGSETKEFYERGGKAERHILIVTFQTQVIKARSLPPGTYAQKVGLVAFNQTLELRTRKIINFSQIPCMHINPICTWSYLERKRYSYYREYTGIY